MIVVADSSPLRYLIALKQQELLPRIFGETWLPSAVVKELSAAAAPLEVREFLNHPPEWLKVRDPSKSALAARGKRLISREGDSHPIEQLCEINTLDRASGDCPRPGHFYHGLLARIFHKESAARRDKPASTSLRSLAVLTVLSKYASARQPSRALHPRASDASRFDPL
jgi:hypothetical protein